MAVVPWRTDSSEGASTRAPIVIDLGGMPRADLELVDALARLQLAAARHGGQVRVRNAPPALCDLLDLAGLRDVVDCEPRALPPGLRSSAVEARWQAEEREEALGIQEEGDPGDPAA